jgi:sugar lactone lactonase YvrE
MSIISAIRKLLFISFLPFFITGVSSSTYAQIITTIAGNGIPGYSGDGGAATLAELNRADNVAMDRSGNIYISDAGNNCIRRINPTGIITTIAGSGTAGYSGDGGPATLAHLNNPVDLVVDTIGNIYFADYSNNAIRKINASGVISTIAGNGTAGYAGDGVAATIAELNGPQGIVFDNAGNLYIGDQLNNRVRKVNTAGIISTIAGNGVGAYSGDGMAATASEVYNPDYLAIDAYGSIYICDNANQRIRKINTSGIISTVAGTGISGYSGDGIAATASEISWPGGIKVDNSGNLYIADCYNSRIRKVNAAGIISTIAGAGVAGYSGDGGPATSAELNHPLGLILDIRGNILIADWYNNVIRSINIGNHPPFFAGGAVRDLSICEDEAPQPIDTLLAVTDSDAGQTETWSLVTPPAHGTAIVAYTTTSTGGTLTPTGLSYSPAVGYSGTDVFVVSVTDGIATATVTINVTVNLPPDAGIISGADSICPGNTTVLSETVTGGIWSNSNASISSINSLGTATGLAPGHDTIIYTVFNGCGASSMLFPFLVRSYTECGTNVGRLGLLNRDGIGIYPNPNMGAFTINISSSIGKEANVVITNAIGQKVYEFNIQTNKPEEITPALAQGIYFIHTIIDGNKYMEKVSIIK